MTSTYQKGRRPNIHCSRCRAHFYRAPAKIKEVNFCSWHCASQERIKLIKCKICDNTFPSAKHKVSCSKECAAKWRARPERKHCIGRPPRTEYLKFRTRSLKRKLIEERGTVCQLCKYSRTEILHIHHIIERHEGGADNLENLLLICPNCHAEIHKGIRKVNLMGSDIVC